MMVLGDRRLTLEDCEAILFQQQPVELAPDALRRVADNFQFLTEFSANKLIYGISTGFGPMAQYRISPADQRQLQLNLIRSHASGAGNLFTPLHARAVLLARLNSLLKGYSGIHADTLLLLQAFLNHDISPCIFEHGGVGASGDLVQLAHLALNLIGEGEVLLDGEVQPAAAVFQRFGLAPLAIHIREGLAVINGTSAMTGIGLINLILAKKLVDWMIMLSAMTNELMEAFDDHFSPELNGVKAHRGQNRVAGAMNRMLADSRLIRKRPEHHYQNQIEEEVLDDKVQEYYSLRCVPQILGPILDTWLQAETVVVDELNSVSDNPVVDHLQQNIYHGGNFHGDYVALEMDKLKIAVTKLSMLSERQLNFLLNDRLNQKLPPFINTGRLGLNLGLQGMQFTATSTVAENQTLSFPMYLHSIPNNNDNQDVVSMGCNAALMTRKVIENTFEVLAIQAIAVTQAVDFLKNADRLSGISQQIYRDISALFHVSATDLPRYKEIAAVRKFLQTSNINLFY